MFMTPVLGMDFLEDKKGVVIHFVEDDTLAEEYLFEITDEAAAFFRSCQNLCEEVKEEPLEVQYALIREFLDLDIGKFNYERAYY